MPTQPPIDLSQIEDNSRAGLPGNADVEWDAFDSDAYFEHNYGELHREDDEIIQIVADHFARRAAGRWRARAVDVGAGANLYPAMTMLPFAAAFMRDSAGYNVGGRSFPACSVTEFDVAKCLADIAYLDEVRVINSQYLRAGYSGMIVATGLKR